MKKYITFIAILVLGCSVVPTTSSQENNQQLVALAESLKDLHKAAQEAAYKAPVAGAQPSLFARFGAWFKAKFGPVEQGMIATNKAYEAQLSDAAESDVSF